MLYKLYYDYIAVLSDVMFTSYSRRNTKLILSPWALDTVMAPHDLEMKDHQ